ncbi:hypothetical protein EVAR_81645_1 [Eumeta japonica]|uniref:Uncharacterized protein n=1 Tax=Eumeta variegata TaxID=151549 RepID=A0A4C1V3K1_EUMVA|nr:hypothetical protein EVAR_81645_1 [Eumeta japonica]
MTAREQKIHFKIDDVPLNARRVATVGVRKSRDTTKAQSSGGRRLVVTARPAATQKCYLPRPAVPSASLVKLRA